jgi:hypothetical protein
MIKIIWMVLLLSICSSSPSQNVITFQVDMTASLQQELFLPDAGDAVILRGSFNDWQSNVWQLKDNDGDSIYSASFNVAGDSGAVIEYKYVILKANQKLLWEKFPDPENPPHGNRKLILTDKNLELPAAKFDFDRYYLALVGKAVLFPVEELKSDFNEFREILENEHCCLYEYTSKKDIDRLFDQQYALIKKPLHPHEFYNILSAITAKIGCLHTAVWMPNGYWDMQPNNLFPLRIKLIDDQVVVSGSYRDSCQIPRGCIIHKINERDIKNIIKEMRENLYADAFNINFINSQIEHRFPMIYASRSGFPQKYLLEYSLPEKKKRLTTELVPAKLSAVRKIIFENFNYPELTLQLFLEKNSALMSVKTFIYYDRLDYFKNFADSCFQIIQEKKIENLILDLRGNDGGDPFCAVHLFSYLEPQPLPYFAEPYGKYSELAKPIPLAANHFNGNLYTLMDGRSASTNGHFLALLKFHQIGKIVGTASGSTYKCNAGKNTQINLSHTCLILTFGRSTFAAAVKGMDKTKPITPDNPVKERYQDFLAGKDVYLEAAFKLIGKSE